MSSLSASLARSGVAEPDRVRRMLEAAPHRGSNLEVRSIGACAIGVSRREDDAAAGISSGERLVAAFAGLLDNAPELRGALIGAGTTPRSDAPADLVEAAWERWGERAPARMRGQFAAAVSDGERIWCFRDQVGFRAVFHRADEWGVFFGSEAKQVLAGAGVAREPDLEAVEAILFGLGGGPDASCPLRGVRRMNAASIVTADRDGISAERLYWHPERLVESGRSTPDEAREQFAELFDQAVGRCLSGRDAISLSGGIDSTAVAAFAAPGHEDRFGSPVAALSAVFPDLPGVDESSWIEMVVEYLKMPLHTYRPHSKSLDDVERWCGLLDAPTPVVSVPELDENYALAATLGHRSLLTGELAEYVIANSGDLPGHLLAHGRISALSSLLRTQRRRGTRLPFILKQFVPALAPGRIANAYLRARGVQGAVPPPDWITRPGIRDVPRPDLLTPIRSRWTALQTRAFGGASETLAADEVVSSMHGVDVRRPFVDVDLWEFFLSLRAEVKFPDTRRKTLVKSCLRGRLPDAILDRKDKTVFGEHLLTHADYDLIGRYLIDPPHRFDGVDYARLAERIGQRDFTLWEFCWARDLTSAHAFPGPAVSDDVRSCQGFTINSEYGFRFTRPGASRDQLSVVPMLGEPPSADQPQILDWQTENGVVARLYGGGRIFTFWAEGAGWFRIAPFDGTIEIPDTAPDPHRREVHLWGVPAMLAFTRRGDLSLHAAAIDFGGSAVLVAAPGQFGKTTLSVACHTAGYRLLSEDISRLQLTPDPLVMPGPAIVRMREDTFDGNPPAGMTIASHARGRVELAIDPERRGDATPVPVRAVVMLRESLGDQVVLERVATMEAIPDLWTLAFRLPESADRSRAFQQVAEFADRVPVWNLSRPLTIDGLPEVVARMAELCET